jgi:hypothetical protein
VPCLDFARVGSNDVHSVDGRGAAKDLWQLLEPT